MQRRFVYHRVDIGGRLRACITGVKDLAPVGRLTLTAHSLTRRGVPSARNLPQICVSDLTGHPVFLIRAPGTGDPLPSGDLLAGPLTIES